mmetsp:Transcript_8157/g.11709  ORF Transcript_8157/g.11709 Transcript_8157/m.11709 type:complete len:399 (-) Transcript_8157:144-1340(-)
MNPATKADGILLTETSFAVAQPITAAQKTRSLQRNGISKKKQEPDMDTDKVTCHKENRYEQNDNEQKRPPYHRCGSSGDALDTSLSETSSSSDSDEECSLPEMLLDEVDALESPPKDKGILLHRKEESDLEITKEEKASKKEFDVSAYMSVREMTPLQERINAITVIPNAFYCLYFLLAGKWLDTEVIERAREAFSSVDVTSFPWIQNMMEFHPATITPPLAVLAVAIGFILHTPFSFMYHWMCAHHLPPGVARIEHWSGRLDKSFIHVMSTCMSYATSGSWKYFLVCALLNADCIYRQFLPEVRPRQNLIRIAVTLTASIMPILWQGNALLFGKIYAVLTLMTWLFAKYPFGGWSHTAFHGAIMLLPPLLMTAACNLSSSRAQIQIAAMCVVLQEKM